MNAEPVDDLTRLDVALVARGLARSRAQAQDAIRDGRVFVGDQLARKAAVKVAADADLRVDEPDPYVARSAHKLVAALDAARVDPRGRLALDAGASTGGFTQVLLERGAREVIALDVGHDQLVAELRDDVRVRVVEGANARELDAVSLARLSGTAEAPSIVVADLSFISLGAVLPALFSVAAEDAVFVLLVKPQFEVGRQLARDGIVRDRTARLRAVAEVADHAERLGAGVRCALSSPIRGTAGNQEYLLVLDRALTGDPTEWKTRLEQLP